MKSMTISFGGTGTTVGIAPSGPDTTTRPATPQAGPESGATGATGATDATAATRTPGGRFPALDVLRGLAILGTLLTNIWIFSAVVGGSGESGERSLGAEIFSTVLSLTTDGKYIGLLTIMFGIGLEIQRQAAIRRGDTWPGTYPWRAGLLILDGLLNYIFIFQFDVLMGYGLTGLVVAFVLASSPKAQKIWMAIGIAAHVAFLTYLSIPMLSDAADEATRTGRGITAQDLQAVAESRGLSMQQVEAALKSGTLNELMGENTSSYWGMVLSRVSDFWNGRGEIPIMFTMGLGLFLVGAHLYRAGLFRPEGGRLRKRVMLASFGIGLPIDVAMRTHLVPMIPEGMYTRYLTSTMVSFGILAAVAAFYAHGRRPGWLGTPLQYVGRMALTCYILQNLICSLIYYDFGLGLARRIPAQWHSLSTLIVYAVVCAMLITLSWAWLRRWKRGPVEWVWHSSHDHLVRLAGRTQARFTSRPSAPPATP